MSGVVSFVGAPQSVGPTNGGKTYGANNLTTAPAIVVVPANPSRRSIMFHNPGTIALYVLMTSKMLLDGTMINNAAGIEAVGGSFLILPGGLLSFVGGEIQLPWAAFSASGSGNPITVMDSNA